jgi:hypothetical protein
LPSITPPWAASIKVKVDVTRDASARPYLEEPTEQSGPEPELDRILIADLSRQLASYLDQCALYGTGPTGHQPQGLLNMSGVAQGVAIDPANLHPSFCAVEEQIELPMST